MRSRRGHGCLARCGGEWDEQQRSGVARECCEVCACRDALKVCARLKVPVLHIHSIVGLHLLTRDNPMVVVDGSANWRGPSRNIAPEISDLSIQYPSVVFAEFDVSASDDVANVLGVTAMQTFVFILNGREVDRVEGANIGVVKRALARLVRVHWLETCLRGSCTRNEKDILHVTPHRAR